MMRQIPHVNDGDLKRWGQMLNAVAPKVQAAVESGALQNGRQLMLHFRNAVNASALAYALGDSDRFLSELKEALQRFLAFFEPKFRGLVEEQFVYEASEDAVCIALILRDPRVSEIARQLLPYGENQSDARAKFTKAIAAVLNGDREGAKKIAGSLVEAPTLSHGLSLPNAIIATVQRDSAGFLAAIAKATSEFDHLVATQARGTPEAVMFIRGAALIRLYETVNQQKLLSDDLDPRLLPRVG